MAIPTETNQILWIALLVLGPVYWLSALWYVRGMRPFAPQSETTPFVSVVVAARNEAANISACLGDLLAQDYPPDSFEIIVVDDGSTDATPDLVRRLQGDGSSLHLLSTEAAYGRSGSKKAALSLAVEAARGELILSTDADCRLGPRWIRGMASQFTAQIGMVVGFSQIGRPHELKGWRQGWEGVDMFCLMAAALGSIGQGKPKAATGQNLGYRKIAFEQVGGYKQVMHRPSGDDVLLLQMIRRLGTWRTAFATDPDTFTVHPSSASWRELLRRRVRWASNSPYQVLFDWPFFVYLVLVYSYCALLVLGPALVLMGETSSLWLGAGWGGKLAADALVFVRGQAILGRGDLSRFFPFWYLTHPFYVLLVGSLGVWGRFSWKGTKARWGSSASVQRPNSSSL